MIISFENIEKQAKALHFNLKGTIMYVLTIFLGPTLDNLNVYGLYDITFTDNRTVA